MAEKATPAPAEGAEMTPSPEDYPAWEQQRQAELRGEEPQKTATAEATSEGEPAPKGAGEPESAEDADTSDQDPEQEEDEDGGEEPQEKSPQRQPARKSGVQKRIDKLTRDKRELEERLRRIEEGLKPAPPKPTPAETPATEAAGPKTDTNEEPRPEAFETYEEYTKAVATWTVDQREKTHADAEKQKTFESEQRAVLDKWTQRLDEARAVHEDYDEVVASDLDISMAMQQALLDSELGAELAYYLGSHPEETAAIAKLTPVASVLALGKIEASLTPRSSTPSSDHAPQRRTVTSAPKPVTPISRGVAGGSESVYDTELANDYKAWENRRRAQLKAA